MSSIRIIVIEIIVQFIENIFQIVSEGFIGCPETAGAFQALVFLEIVTIEYVFCLQYLFYPLQPILFSLGENMVLRSLSMARCTLSS